MCFFFKQLSIEITMVSMKPFVNIWKWNDWLNTYQFARAIRKWAKASDLEDIFNRRLYTSLTNSCRSSLIREALSGTRKFSLMLLLSCCAGAVDWKSWSGEIGKLKKNANRCKHSCDRAYRKQLMLWWVCYKYCIL